jgi:two-component system, OmpR family, sensor kinase
MSIRTRLTLWFCALLATVIIVFGVSLFALLNWALRAQMQEQMQAAAEQMRAAVGNAFDPFTGEFVLPTLQTQLQHQLSKMPSFASAYSMQIWWRDGRLVEQTGSIRQAQPFDPTTVQARAAVISDVYLADQTHALIYTVPLLDLKGRPIGIMQMMSPLTTLEAATDRLVRVLLILGAVALVVSFFMGTVITGQALQPIENISHIARQITAADDLSKRIPYDGPMDELGQLTETFNKTLGRLDRLFAAQRRFVGDVSHELRTPLTTIQGNVDMIKRFYPQLRDSLEIENIEGENQRMTRLVDDLLTLAQADGGRLPITQAPVEFESLLLEVYRQTSLLAQQVHLRLGNIDAVRVLGDKDRLKQLLLNLTTNAIKYTPAGGQVTLSLRHERQFAVLMVSDTGIGIPPEDQPHIFERFYRVDKARARAMGGAGLGLSIVKWIVEAHKGRIEVVSVLQQGTTFTVYLPSLSSEQYITPDSTRETRQKMPALLRRKA